MLATKSNTYTFQKNGIWYFSRRVPSDLRRHYKTGRIAYSLRTRSLRQARMRALSDAAKFAIDDHVVLSSCTNNTNNGEYIISGINSAIISLVNVDGSTVSGLDATDNTCKMGHAGGRLVNLVANSQADGTILDINVQGLASGTAFEF